MTSTHACAHKRDTLARFRTGTLRHTHGPGKQRHTCARTDECWHTVTHTHKRSESSSQLTSPTRTCLDFFPSPPYPSDDVFATSGGTHYIRGCRDTTLVGGREKARARERKEPWLPEMAEQLREREEKKSGAEREKGPLIGGDIDGRIPWQIYHTPRVVKPQSPRIPQQKAWVPPSGHPVAIWPFSALWGCCSGLP